MKTTLQIFQESSGLVVADIGDARHAFLRMPMTGKDKICNALMRAIDAKELADIIDAAPFFQARVT